MMVLSVILAGALEDSLPALAGVGLPFLLGVVIFAAVNWPTHNWIMTALMAGALEEALSGLPLGTCLFFYLAVAALVRWTRFPQVAMLFAFPAYEVWLAMWLPGDGGVFLRTLLAFPFGLIVSVLVFFALDFLSRKVGIDAQ